MSARSLRVQVFACLFGLVAVTVAGFATTLYTQRRAALLANLERELATRAEGVASLCEWEAGAFHFEGSPHPDDPRSSLLRDAAVAPWPDGRPILGDAALFGAIADQGSAASAATALLADVERGERLVYRRVIAIPARPARGSEPAEPEFAVTVATSAPTAPMHADLASLQRMLWVSGGSLLVLAALLSAWLARRIIRPIAALAAAVQHLGPGPRQPMPRGASLETDALAAAFDAAFARVEAAAERIARFSSDASHELRTPLAVLQTTADVALLERDLPNHVRESLEAIRAATQRMTETTESLLLLARADAGQLAGEREPCRLDLLAAAEVAAATSTAAEHGMRLTLDAVVAVTVPGVPGLLRCMLRNLITNAVTHAGRPGAIRVTVRNGAAPVVAVADEGVGIPAVDLPRVFDRFSRGDPSRNRASGGVGLGLSLVQSIAAAHGAQCSISSRVGVGTTVAVSFVGDSSAPPLP